MHRMDLPAFPPPTTREERAQVAPEGGAYRRASSPAAAAVGGARGPSVAEAPSRPSPERIAAGLRRTRASMRLVGLGLVAGGLTLAGAALALGVSSHGRAIPIGLVGVGVVIVARGFERLLRSLLSDA